MVELLTALAGDFQLALVVIEFLAASGCLDCSGHEIGFLIYEGFDCLVVELNINSQRYISATALAQAPRQGSTAPLFPRLRQIPYPPFQPTGG